MKSTSLLLACLLPGITAPAFAHEKPERIIVKFKSNDAVKSFVQNKNLVANDSEKTLTPIANGAFVLTISQQKSLSSDKQSLDALLESLNAREDVIYAVKDRLLKFKPTPAVEQSNRLPSTAQQWDNYLPPGGVHLESSPGQSDGGWQYSRGESNPSVVVAVLDTGVESNHRLSNNLTHDTTGRVFGWNFAGNNADVQDETGSYHGTHVAGTIASSGTDMVGMAPALKVLPVKIPDSTGMFYESAVINGIYWSLGYPVPGTPYNPYPAQVMNMSFGIDEGPGRETETCNIAVQEAIDAANAAGSVIVVAAGNNNADHDLGSPGGCEGVIRVTSTGPAGLRAYYSNYGNETSYAAPGGDKQYGTQGAILSTVQPGGGIQGSGLDYKQGTSMAAPHVAGLFGLVFAYGQNQGITIEQAKALVYSTTHDFGLSDNPDNDCVSKKPCGHGIIDANQALSALQQGYTTFINAPARLLIPQDASQCGQTGTKPTVANVTTNAGTWKQLTNNCSTSYALPKLSINDTGILADYDGFSYLLAGNYQNCDVIGADGIGCK